MRGAQVRWELDAGYRRHASLLLGVAALGAAADLTSKLAAAGAVYGEGPPSPAGFALLSAGLAFLVPFARSLGLSVGAGLLVGGAAGNLASPLLWSRGVPDFIRVGAVVLNVADLLVWAGLLVLLAAAWAVVRRLAPRASGPVGR